LAVTPLVEEAGGRKRWPFSALAFTMGLVLVMGAIGAVVSGLGAGLVAALSQVTPRLALAVVVYSLVGLFALAYGLSELGFLRLPNPWPYLPMPSFVGPRGYQRSFLLGSVVGGGFGLGCPFPTYYVLLAWVAAAGNPLYGAALLALNALGRASPSLFLGSALLLGIPPQRVTRWLVEKRPAVKLVNAIGLTMLGVFLVVYWGIRVTWQALL